MTSPSAVCICMPSLASTSRPITLKSLKCSTKSSTSFSESVKGRFESYNWQYLRVEDGNNLEEIAKALHGNNRQDYLFGLKQELKSYQFFQRSIKACDKQIEAFIKKELKQHPDRKKLKTTQTGMAAC